MVIVNTTTRFCNYSTSVYLSSTTNRFHYLKFSRSFIEKFPFALCPYKKSKKKSSASRIGYIPQPISIFLKSLSVCGAAFYNKNSFLLFALLSYLNLIFLLKSHKNQPSWLHHARSLRVFARVVPQSYINSPY